MPTYTANAERAGYDVAFANYETLHAQWVATEAQRQDDYQRAHDAWTASPGETPEPQPPEPTPEPFAPAQPQTFEGREISEPEEIDTTYGPTLVLPPRVLLTAQDGHVFAVAPADLARDYSELTVNTGGT